MQNPLRPKGLLAMLALLLSSLAGWPSVSAQRTERAFQNREDDRNAGQSSWIWSSLPSGIHSDTYAQLELMVFSGSLDLLTATWTAHAAEEGHVPLLRPLGFSWQRKLRLSADGRKLQSTVPTFGLACPDGTGQKADSPYNLAPCLMFERNAEDTVHIGAPGRFTWWGRVVLPLDSAEQQRPLSERLLYQVLQQASFSSVERELAPGQWERVSSDPGSMLPVGPFREYTEEDWYFEPNGFRLHARVTALIWRTENGGRFRLRFVE